MKFKEKSRTVELKSTNVVDMYVNEFANGTSKSVYITQERTTTYPAKRFDTGFGDGLYDNPDGKSYDQTRHVLVNVPEDETLESVEERIKALPNACIFRILSHNFDDVLGERELGAIEAGYREKEDFRTRFLVRDSEGNVYSSMTKDGKALKDDDRVIGKIVEDDEGNEIFEQTNPNAMVEYKRDIFSREYKPDIDLREKPVEAEVEKVEEASVKNELVS